MGLEKKNAVQFLRRCSFGSISTISEAGRPEAALINLAVTDDLELVFETIQTTRKCINLRANPHVAVVAWNGSETLQYEGLAREPDEYALKPLLDIYFAAQPDALGHRGWPGLTYFRVQPQWIRLSRYGTAWSVKELRIG